MLVLRQVDEETPGQRDLCRQAGALGADRVLDHLHQHRLPLEQHALDALRLGRVLALLEHVGDMQEGRAFEADLDEGALHARQHPLDLAQVDVADDAAAGRALDVQLLHHRVLEHGDPGLLRGDVDEDLLLGPLDVARQGDGLVQHGAPHGKVRPKAVSRPAVSNSGSPITPVKLPSMRRTNTAARPWMP